ncbi:hypothetical protein HBA54_17240 [Pelagibius litoralis]|uniref:Uncharacterized protein n=1 Tax=Pelagibius litoralis TaxID=374515 RepID=A0A967EZI8_9PROT|nr:hypothetical protein [Pelagibius litoralis]NIA70353.1 hypothetical protein [Pelagibius litoralis]
MATPTLSTRLSRRAMLAGSVAAPAMAFPVFQALAALPVPALLCADPHPDAELFRRIAEAEHLRNQNARARRLRARLRDALYARHDLAYRPFRDSHPEAWLHCWETHGRYADAVREAVAVPAHTVAGIHAKLSLAVIASRRGGARVYMYEDREWLQAALVDLERLANPGQRVGPVRRWTPDPLVLA